MRGAALRPGERDPESSEGGDDQDDKKNGFGGHLAGSSISSRSFNHAGGTHDLMWVKSTGGERQKPAGTALFIVS